MFFVCLVNPIAKSISVLDKGVSLSMDKIASTCLLISSSTILLTWLQSNMTSFKFLIFNCFFEDWLGGGVKIHLETLVSIQM